VVLTVAEALAWYLIHPYDERNLYLYLDTGQSIKFYTSHPHIRGDYKAPKGGF
jgi:hypothetical protein